MAYFTAALLSACLLGLARQAGAQAAPTPPTLTPSALSSTTETTTPTEPTPAPSEYDALVLRALAAYDAGRWDQSRELFERAHALDPTARTLRTIGMTAFNQGDYVGALRHLEMALVDTRKPLTDEQRTHVLGLIDRANRKVARYRVRMSPAGASLLVDGASPLLLSEDELLLVPGSHVLRVTALGHRPIERTLQAQGGDRQKLELALEPEGSVPGSSQLGSATPRASSNGTAVDLDHDTDQRTFGIVALSIGGAVLVVSGITLGLALADKSELDDGCPDRVCPADEPDLEDTRSRYQTLRIVSPVALGVGVVGAAVGVLLLLSGEPAANENASAAANAPRAFLSADGLGVRGTL